MNHTAMLELLDARPFAPFEIITSGAQVHAVRHPENVVLTKTRIVVVDPEADTMSVVPLLHITEARFLTSAGA
ncbi:MAG: hypothetical protein AAGB00_10400 [Planctomycetota bacterium]